MSKTKPPSIEAVINRLDAIAYSTALSDECREAARWACSMILTLRAEAGFDWDIDAETAVRLTQNRVIFEGVK